MYKDRDKAKATDRERQRRYRASKGVTEDVTEPQGVTRVETKGVTEAPRTRRDKEVKGVTIPEFARVLPQSTINKVQAILRRRAELGLPDDSQGRWSRAVSYLHGGILAGQIVDWRPELESICESLGNCARDVRVGVYGPDLSVVEEMLEITA